MSTSTQVDASARRELFSSTLPVDVLYDGGSLPRADDELAPATTPSLGKRLHPVEVGENFPPAQAPALVVKRPMAISPPAVDERAALSPSAAVTGHLPAPTFGRQRATTKFSSLTSHPEEPCNASQSL
jgi:hypothetical protein